MNVDKAADLYCDYLVASIGLTTSTGLAAVLDGEVSHDKVTRFLANEELDSKWGWKQSKQMAALYKKQWRVEEYNKSLKNNSSL